MDIKEELSNLICEAYHNYLQGDGHDSMSVNFADHLIANGVTVNEWISVKDRLPETNYRTMVIVCVDGNKSAARWFERTMISGKLVERFKYPWDVITCENITHWMPLPQPPKGE